MAKKRRRAATLSTGAKKQPRKRATLRPTMRAFLACEFVSSERPVSKTTLVGLFDAINFESIPAAFKPFSLWVKLIGGSGGHAIELIARGTAGERVDLGAKLDIDLNASPQPGAEITINVAPMVFQKPGTVAFVLLCDGTPIGWECEIKIVLVTEKDKKK